MRHLKFGEQIQPELNSVHYSADGKTNILEGPGLIVAYNTETDKQAVIPTDSRYFGQAVGPDGRTVAASEHDGQLHLRDIVLRKEVHRFPPKKRLERPGVQLRR